MFKTIWTGFFSKAISLLASLLTVRWPIQYLGKEDYGIRLGASSLVAIMGFIEVGAGNATLNTVAHADLSNKTFTRKIISNSIFSNILLALGGLTVFLLVFPFISWQEILGIQGSNLVVKARNLVLILGVFFYLYTVYFGWKKYSFISFAIQSKLIK